MAVAGEALILTHFQEFEECLEKALGREPQAPASHQRSASASGATSATARTLQSMRTVCKRDLHDRMTEFMLTGGERKTLIDTFTQRASDAANQLLNFEAIPAARSIERQGQFGRGALKRLLVSVFQRWLDKTCEDIIYAVSEDRAIREDGQPSRARRLHQDQTIAILEFAFSRCNVVNAAERQKIAEAAGLSERQVMIWFQNRRHRGKPSKRSSVVMGRSVSSFADAESNSKFDDSEDDYYAPESIPQGEMASLHVPVGTAANFGAGFTFTPESLGLPGAPIPWPRQHRTM